jgi:sensor histidine kinase YesM
MKIFILLTGFKDVWDEFGGWYFSGIFIFLCWTGIFQWMHYYNLLMIEHKIMLDAEAASREEHIKRLQAQREARDYKLKMLRYQLNPHFLYNSLNAINSLVEMEQSKKAQKMVEQLSDFLRYSIDNDPDLKIHLTKEIEALNLYLAIEKTRFGNRLNVKFNINSDIETALIPSLLLQPIIENSMKYAIAMSEDGGTIEISADVNLNGNFLHLSVKDTGNNTLGKSELEKNSNNEKNRVGLGLTNINQRLYAFYFQNYSLNSESNEMGGLTTNILIPLEFE